MTVVHEMTERPPGFVAPNLRPTGLTLQPREVGDGVYALMANQLPKDNNGLIVGEDAALVVDAGRSLVRQRGVWSGGDRLFLACQQSRHV